MGFGHYSGTRQQEDLVSTAATTAIAKELTPIQTSARQILSSHEYWPMRLSTSEFDGITLEQQAFTVFGPMMQQALST